jgi:putative NADPH-quinone reductase
MKKQIAIVQGHVDPRGRQLGRALAGAYAASAEAAGFQVEVIDVLRLKRPLLGAAAHSERATPGPAIRDAQAAIARATHVVIFCPLWLGTMPVLLRDFWAQVFQAAEISGSAEAAPDGGPAHAPRRKSARIVMTLGMPAVFYRSYFGTYELKSLERDFLGFCGIGRIRENLVGAVEAQDAHRRDKWLERMRGLGRAGV